MTKGALLEVDKRRSASKFPFYAYRIPDKVDVPIHWHLVMEIFYTEVDGIVYINNREYIVFPGDILFINPGMIHRSYRKSDGAMYHVGSTPLTISNQSGSGKPVGC